ncbi:MAG: hypothetical protein KTR24_04750 [Saprospiraceae bacterium]|nr:hypothetical protein [Saprospiraceae bacterium]
MMQRKQHQDIRVAVCHSPDFSHIVATLPLVSLLVKHSVQVRVYSYSHLEPYLSQTKAAVLYVDKAYPSVPLHRGGGGAVIDVELSRYRQHKAISKGIIAEFSSHDFDLIIVEEMCLWGKLLSVRFSLPMVMTSTAIRHSFDHPEFQRAAVKQVVLRPLRSIIKYFKIINIAHQLRRRFEVSASTLRALHYKRNADLKLLYMPKDPFYLADKGANQVHVAPNLEIKERCEGDFTRPSSLSDRALIYVSMGTVHARHKRLMNTIWSALEDAPYAVIFSLGGVSLDQLAPKPDHFLAQPYWPQIAVLREADLFITHGGANSVLEGILTKTPMLGIPQGYDQFYLCDQLQDHGIGSRIEKAHLTKIGIRKHVDEALANSESRAPSLTSMRERLMAGATLEESFKRIMDLVTTKNS